ncbi:MAG: sigma-E processing peptidase SpoIIGA [Clostridia bacterium]|nr:sigma-E processing peptidase SpoIIGA [Clostridia bacterium]
MTVYIEYVLIDNFLIDYFLLKTTFFITGKTAGRVNVVLAATTGATLAVLYPLLPDIAVVSAIIKVCSGLIVTFAAANYKSVKDFYLNAVVFFALTFALGGAVIGAFNILGLDYRSETVIALMALPAYAFIRLLRSVVGFVFKRRPQESACVFAEINFGGKTTAVKGLIDTGNAVYNDGRPVIFCDKKTAIKIMGETLPKFGKIPLNTVAGKTFAISFKVDEIKIFIGDKTNIFKNVTVAAVKNVGYGYDVILHPAFMEVKNEYITAS